MILLPPRSTRTDTLFPYTTLFRSASGWQVADGGRRYTFDLRTDLHWSNGESLAAADFVRSLQRAVDPKTGSPFAQLLSPIANADAITRGDVPASILAARSEEHTSELQSLMRRSSAVFCLKKKKTNKYIT